MVSRSTVPPARDEADVPGATPRTVRAINDRVTLELLLQHRALTRTQLAGLTGLSKPTATQLLQRLAESGLIVPRGTTTGAPGPNAQLYGLNERAAFVAAVDVDEHRLTAAVADLAGNVLGEVSAPADFTGPEDPVPAVRQMLGDACRRGGVKLRDLDSVVLGVPAAYDAGSDRLTFADHIPGWAEEQTLARLRLALRAELVVENDVKLAAVWERGHGAARDADSFALLWIGTGVGLAVDIGGSLYTGATGGAGEIGYMRLGLRPIGPRPAARHVQRPRRRGGGGGPRPRARPARRPRGGGRRRPAGPDPRHAVPLRTRPAAGRRTGADRRRPGSPAAGPRRPHLRSGRRGAGAAGHRGDPGHVPVQHPARGERGAGQPCPPGRPGRRAGASPHPALRRRGRADAVPVTREAR